MSDETDQALASFRAAQRLAPAHNVPLLYMGMEYLRTNHLVLARHFLMAANKTSHGGDPLCLHELGVADYQRKEFATAAVWFQRALMASGGKWEEGSSSSRSSTNHDPVELCQDVFWEPTLFNLGQCYRKSRQFGEAKRCFEKCLSLCPVSFVSCVHVYIVTDMIVYVYTHGFRFRLTISTTGERVLLFCTGIHQALVWGHRRCH
jgi:tetratricopeptide (TPR) repeat protein